MSSTIIIVATALPIVAGLQRFCVNYGYRGQSRESAVRDAISVAVMMALCIGVLLFFYSEGQFSHG